MVAVIRPEEIELAPARRALVCSYLAAGVVEEVAFTGALERLRIRLSGGATELNPGLIFSKRANVQGISVGSTQMFEAMNSAIDANNIKPVIDRVYPLSEIRAAHERLEAKEQFGKVVVVP